VELSRVLEKKEGETRGGRGGEKKSSLLSNISFFVCPNVRMPKGKRGEKKKRKGGRGSPHDGRGTFTDSGFCTYGGRGEERGKKKTHEDQKRPPFSLPPVCTRKGEKERGKKEKKKKEKKRKYQATHWGSQRKRILLIDCTWSEKEKEKKNRRLTSVASHRMRKKKGGKKKQTRQKDYARLGSLFLVLFLKQGGEGGKGERGGRKAPAVWRESKLSLFY